MVTSTIVLRLHSGWALTMGSGFAIGGKLTTLYTDSPLHSPTHHVMHAYYTTQQQQWPEFRGEPLQRLTMDLDTSGEGVLCPCEITIPSLNPTSIPSTPFSCPHTALNHTRIYHLASLRPNPTLSEVTTTRGFTSYQMQTYAPTYSRLQLLNTSLQLYYLLYKRGS